jgi:hypothetical protein
VNRRSALDRFFVSSGLVFGLLAGCSQDAPPPTVQQIHLKDLAVAYGRFIASHRGQSPKDEKEFKAFVQTMLPYLPSKPTDVDSLFVSPRDNQPYVVRYGASSAVSGSGQAPVVAYEQQGVDGNRFIATILGAVEEVDEARFRELVPDAT